MHNHDYSDSGTVLVWTRVRTEHMSSPCIRSMLQIALLMYKANQGVPCKLPEPRHQCRRMIDKHTLFKGLNTRIHHPSITPIRGGGLLIAGLH